MSGGTRRIGIAAAIALLFSLIPAAESVFPEAAGVAAYTPRGPIQIIFDSEFTSGNGVTGGSGTADDPYVIEGWEISAPSTFGIEILATSAHFVVRNVLIHGPSTGIHLFNLANGRIEDSVIHGVSEAGIHLERATAIRLGSNNLSLMPGPGIRLDSCTNITVEGNDLASSGGIVMYGSSTSLIASNNITDGGLLYVVGSDGIELRANRLSNSRLGIDLERSTNVTAIGNILDRHGLVIAGDLHSHYSSHTIGADNIIGDKPIRYYRDCSGLVVNGLPTASLIVANCTASRFANLSIGDVDLAIHVAFSDGIAVEENRVWGTVTGIALYAATGTLLRANAIAWSGALGIAVTASADVTIEGNDIADVGGGPSVGQGLSIYSTSGLHVYHNNLIDVQAQASDFPGGNAWDAGYPAGGNYWSAFTGWNDQCSGPAQDVCPDPDGIYDIPFAVSTEITDRYPLVRPVGARGGTGVNATLYGATVAGWGHDSVTLSNPGPALLAWQGSMLNLTLVSADGGLHGWFIDLDGNSLPDANEPSSPDFSGTTEFRFTPTQAGNFTYRCRFHPASMTGVIEIRPFEAAPEPNSPPIASFVVTPSQGNQTTHFRVDASASSDAEDPAPFPEIHWDWEGDGTFDTDWSTTKTAEHVYEAGGVFAITLEVRDAGRLTAGAVQTVRIELVPLAPLVLTAYSHASGFSLPIPQGWTVLEDRVVQGVTVELTLLGPSEGGIQTNIVVDAGEDPSVRETDAYLLDLVNASVAAAQARVPEQIEITEGPTLRTIGDHAAVSFKLLYGRTNLTQKGAIVVSEAHHRYWILVLTTDSSSYLRMEEGFERMLAGFEITASGSPSGSEFPWALLGAAAGGAGAAVGVVIFLIQRRKARSVTPPAIAPTFPSPSRTSPGTLHRVCIRCGNPATDNQVFCRSCGAPLPPP